jgi:uncharacterized protein YkwD
MLGTVVAMATADAAQGAAARPPRALDAAVVRQVVLINRFRTAHHLPRLRLDGQLTASATWMARDMATKNYFAHRDSHRRGWFRRLEDFHYPVLRAWTGENIAAGHEDAAATYDQWLHSAPHRHNWLNPHFRAIGIARVYVADSPYRWYWVTDFGSQRRAPLCAGLRTGARCI